MSYVTCMGSVTASTSTVPGMRATPSHRQLSSCSFSAPSAYVSKLHKVIKFNLKDRYLNLAYQCNTLRELLESYDTSPDDYTECSAVSTNDTHTSEHVCASTSVDLMTGSPDHVSSPCAGDRGSSSCDVVLESTESSSVEQQQNSSPQDGEVLQSPTAKFTHAVEWLHTTVTSLSNFIEHNNIHKKR